MSKWCHVCHQKKEKRNLVLHTFVNVIFHLFPRYFLDLCLLNSGELTVSGTMVSVIWLESELSGLVEGVDLSEGRAWDVEMPRGSTSSLTGLYLMFSHDVSVRLMFSHDVSDRLVLGCRDAKGIQWRHLSLSLIPNRRDKDRKYILRRQAYE